MVHDFIKTVTKLSKHKLFEDVNKSAFSRKFGEILPDNSHKQVKAAG